MPDTTTSDLRLLGIKAATRQVLERNGIFTIAQLRKSLLALPSRPGISLGMVNETVGSLMRYDDSHRP
jgi:hypothetical protein